MNDLTLIYLSANILPIYTQGKVLDHLYKQTKEQYPIVFVTQGKSYPLVGSSPYNYYRQILNGCYQARTEFVATCEDDTLYPSEHFTFRPAEGFNYAYNTNTWLGGDKVFWRSPNMNSFGFYISRRMALIELLENRFRVYPTEPARELQRHFHEPGVFEYDQSCVVEKFSTEIPIIAFEHRGTLSGKRKRFGDNGTPEIEYYGSAKQLYSKYWPSQP